jgi:hypothetical protein
VSGSAKITVTAIPSNANWYVDQRNGSDNNPGTIDEPFQTIRRALVSNILTYSNQLNYSASGNGWTAGNATVTPNASGVGYGDWNEMTDNSTNSSHYIKTTLPSATENIGRTFVSVRATHSVPAPRLVMHWSYERSGSDSQAAKFCRGPSLGRRV